MNLLIIPFTSSKYTIYYPKPVNYDVTNDRRLKRFAPLQGLSMAGEKTQKALIADLLYLIRLIQQGRLPQYF